MLGSIRISLVACKEKYCKCALRGARQNFLLKVGAKECSNSDVPDACFRLTYEQSPTKLP